MTRVDMPLRRVFHRKLDFLDGGLYLIRVDMR